VPIPDDISTNASATHKRVWEQCIGKFFKQDNRRTANLETAISLVMEYCYKTINDNFDLIKLIKAIKGLTYQF
jgi:hypothetical protein